MAFLIMDVIELGNFILAKFDILFSLGEMYICNTCVYHGCQIILKMKKKMLHNLNEAENSN